MSALSVALGVLIIALTLWEIFHDLFHPSSSGALTKWIARGLVRLGRPSRKRMATAGPLTIVVVIAIWAAALIVGFALILAIAYPADFRTSTGTVPPAAHRYIAALYLSFETLVTLGYGDLVPQAPWMRFITATEALIGFGMVTASVSSIVLIYPALTRMRNSALEVFHLSEAERRTGLTPATAESELLLVGLAGNITQVRVDLVHFPVLYFFAPENNDASIPKWTGVLSRYAREGLEPGRSPQVRLAAAALDASLDNLARLFADDFVSVPNGDRESVFDAVAKYHEIDRVGK